MSAGERKKVVGMRDLFLLLSRTWAISLKD